MKNKKTCILLLALLLFSCNTAKRTAHLEQKHKQAAILYFATHSPDFADQCAVQFPPKVIDSIVFKPGKTEIVHDTPMVDISAVVAEAIDQNIQGITDSVKQSLLDSIRHHPLMIKVPVTSTQKTDTFYNKQTVTNTAEIEACNKRYADLQQQNATINAQCAAKQQQVSDVTKQRNKLLWIAIAAIGYTLLRIIIKLWKPTSLIAKFFV